MSLNMEGRILFNAERFGWTIERLCQELVENYGDFTDTCLVGVQTGGVPLAERMHQRLLELTGVPHIEHGALDITFYRDDFRTKQSPLKAATTRMNFIVEAKNVILIDDVLYTGRTTQAALTALQHYGRPRRVELLTLVDRRYQRHLPVQPDYIGMQVDSLDKSHVKVEWAEADGADRVLLIG